jgi:hypothetical protein
MSLDRFITYGSTSPTVEQVGLVCEQYFGLDIAKVEWNGTQRRYYVTLAGKWSHPLRNVVELPPGSLEWGAPPHDERVIEVYVGDVAEREPIDVITRHADDFTNASADGLAAVLARGWGGQL